RGPPASPFSPFPPWGLRTPGPPARPGAPPSPPGRVSPLSLWGLGGPAAPAGPGGPAGPAGPVSPLGPEGPCPQPANKSAAPRVATTKTERITASPVFDKVQSAGDDPRVGGDVLEASEAHFAVNGQQRMCPSLTPVVKTAASCRAARQSVAISCCGLSE